MGEASAPRSAGCSRMNSVPAAGGPPSAELSLEKNLDTEKLEHGGDAKTAMMSWAPPPPSVAQLSTQLAVSP
eukprot:820657-Pleurochrysis_carterae.AAC.7